MKKFFQNNTNYKNLHDLNIKICEYDKVLIDFKTLESNWRTYFYDKLTSKEFNLNFYIDPLELKKYSSYFDFKNYVSSLVEEEIDRETDSVGFARQLKRKRRALLEIQAKLQKNKKKLLSIRNLILKFTHNYNVTHDYRQDLRQVLKNHMPLSVDEDESNSITLLKSFNSLNALIEFTEKNIKNLNLWIRKSYFLLLNKYLNRKNYQMKTELLLSGFKEKQIKAKPTEISKKY